MADVFPKEAFDNPLYVGDGEVLRTKLTNAGGLLREYWADFRNRVLSDPDQRREMVFLAALLSDEATEEAAAELQRYYRALAASDTAGDVQFHTWCRGGAVTRRVAFFDWLAHRQFWQPDDVEEAAESFLGFAFKHSHQVLTSRRRASDNQALSMTLNCAVSGFVFGHKLCNHPTGKFLFEYGVNRLPDLIGLFPGDGYGGEGSTYTSHVNTALACWVGELLRHVSGRDLLDAAFEPNGTTLRKMIEMELRLLSPGGLLAPWDHYGWQREINASPFAYLAKATGDPRYLALIPSLDLWRDPGMLAWGHDDPLWTLVWWPEECRDYDERELPEELFGWGLPKTGAALDDCRRRSRLMQVWDRSAETLHGVGRAQVNPNHLIFEYGGEPVLQDGIPDKDADDPWQYPIEKVLARMDDEARERYLRYFNSIGGSGADWAGIVRGVSSGLLGAANAIVIDDEPWYWPGEARVGCPEFYGRGDGLQAVSADTASIYCPDYDVRVARRTSIWTEAGFGVVLDTLLADSDHSWSWQAYTRPDLELGEDCARVQLTNGNMVLFAWAAGPQGKAAVVEGYPGTYEKRSQRLTLELRGRAAQFTVLIAPNASKATIKREGPLVTVTIDGETHELVVENFERAECDLSGGSASAIFAWRYGDETVLHDENQMPEYRPDVLEAEDITCDCDVQLRELRELTAWEPASTPTASSGLWEIDACLAQLRTADVDEQLLLDGLRSSRWPVQVAAAITLGERGCHQAAPALRELLEREHAIPEAELYPHDGQGGEPEGKRWRLKTALILALGRLKDRESVPLMHRILSDSRDFYAVYSAGAQALGRIGGEEARAALEPALQETEINTFMRARHAAGAIE